VTITIEQAYNADEPEHTGQPTVSLIKTEPETETETGESWVPSWVQQANIGTAVREHLHRAGATTKTWLQTVDITEEQLAAAVLADRQTQHHHRENQLRQQLGTLSSQIVAAKRTETADGEHNDPHRDSAPVIALKGRRELVEAELQEHQRADLTQAPTSGEMSRARWSRKAARVGALVAAAAGEFVLPMQDARLLLLTVPVTAVALWRAGAIANPEEAQVSAASGKVVAAVLAEGAPAADARWPLPGHTAATGEGEALVTVPGTLPADPTMPPSGTFPIARVSTPQWAGECVRRALVKEKIPVAEITDVQQQPWGWTCKVRISEGTPESIIKAAPDLETLMDLETGRCIPTPTKRRAVIDLKVAHTDPFAFVPGPPCRAPKSMSIKDKALLGYAMDARPLEMSLYGVQGAVVAGSGGGKSANIRTFAEYLTACRDTVVVSLDPSGVGLGPLEDAAALTLTSKDEIECFLRGMHQVSLKRPELLGKLKMGTEWQPSERWPALVAIGDEWPQTTDASKESGVGIQLTGRKVCAQLLIASQFATADYIGSAIISNLSLQVLGPCRAKDVVETFGGGAIADGWLPHRLVPKQADELNDVGKFYLRGGGYGEPIIWRGNWYDDDTCLELAEERAAAGVSRLDEESLRFGGREFSGLFERRGTAAKAVKAASGDRILGDVVAVLTGAGLDRARTERMAEMLSAADPAYYAGITGTEVGERLRKAGAGGTVKLGPTDGMANPNGYKLTDLIEAYDTTR
jgi:S-DNA-T family DNA segregation ATPase FtsK/SpoIIIE